jgi:hypothetical protein
MTALPAVEAVVKRSDPVTLPSPQKDLRTPIPAAGFPQSRPHSGLDSLPTQPQPLYTTATSSLAPWQWAVAVVAGAVFLYNVSVVISITLLLFSGFGSSGLGSRILTNLALAGLAGFGVMWVLQDRKVVLTFVVGGIALRSMIRVLVTILTTQALTLLFEWLILGAASIAALWWIWKLSPPEAGDGSRLNIALTALIGAELTTIVYGIAINPAYLSKTDLIAAVLVTGVLVVLRLKLPSAPGPAAAGPAAALGQVSPGIDPRFRRVLLIVAYILIAVILRVFIRAAFR